MNFDDSLFANATPQEQYEPVPEWMLSPGAAAVAAAPSPVTSKLYSGYAFPGTGVAGEGTEAERAYPYYYGQGPAPMTREEQATDTSYSMLATQRNSNLTVEVDGKIQEPHLNDVLCGRGGSINSHPGNRVFRGWIAERKESYNLADTKADKSRITGEIMYQVRDQNPPGRFLQKVVEGGGKKNDPYVHGWWTEIDEPKALAKISQALREGAPAFRALHGKKGRKKQPSPAPQRASSGRQPKKKGARTVTERDNRKDPPRMQDSPPAMKPVESAAMKQETATTPPPSANAHGHELDVLFPTANNFFATSHQNGNGLLSSYPLVHMGDYTAPMDEVARAIPTPPTTKKPRASVPPSVPPQAQGMEAQGMEAQGMEAQGMEAQGKSGKCTTPSFGPAPNTPLVSPGFSPYGQAKAAWDALSFLPNLSPGAPGSPVKPRLLQRSHSLSFSDNDVRSVGSFQDPFETNSGQQKPDEVDLEVPPSSEDRQANTLRTTFPPPMGDDTPPHGLSFGRIGSVPGGNGFLVPTKSTSRSTSRSSYHREGSVSSTISNLNNKNKRKSIA